ncbi:MAG: hypothetical protein IKP64_10190 [Selenomonadaceae bacterium]|nr:hypothetical protein [Selenomonadaceae bacterium]
MLTSINIANALSTVAANVDGSFVTQDNAIFATGYSNGSAVLNLGTAAVTADFAASGSAAYDTANNHAVIADGSFIALSQSINNANIALAAQGNVGGTLDLNAAGLSFTPDIGDGRLGISVAKDGATLDLSLDGTGTINVGTNGAISFGTLFVPVVTAPKDFSLNFAAKTYTGIPLAGNIHGDGVNDVQATLVNGTQIALTTNGFVGADLNFGGLVALNNVKLSGSLILDPLTSTLTFGQGSTLGVDLGGRHIDITATDNAGGQLTLGANGLTFKSAGGDGGLILSVTDGGQTRQASLNFAGEINYALDGSITLAQGTVVNNVFADGNVLTITALTDASGSMIFDPNGGLYVTPSTPDALNVVLSTDGLDIVNISSITGTINYKSGVVTASAGTKARISYYFGWESELRTTGGPASIQFTADRTIYTAGEGSTFAVDYLDGTTTEIQNGTYSDIYGENIEDYVELVSEGTTLRNNDNEQVFTLETAGNYNLNGINVITTEDNLEVQLANYDTVIVGDLAYTALNENSAIAISDAGVVGINEVSVNPISLFISADLAGDFLPNYETDFANALQIVDAGTFDNQLSEILPAENLGEVSFVAQADELSQTPQIVIAPTK